MCKTLVPVAVLLAKQLPHWHAPARAHTLISLWETVSGAREAGQAAVLLVLKPPKLFPSPDFDKI